MSLNKKSVDDINVKGQRVLCRCDFNVPLKEGKITDENRLVAALPTIKKLIADGGKVILCSHLGKVKTEEDKKTKTLAPVAVRLSELLGQEVKFVAEPEVVGPKVREAVAAMKDGEVILLENTRFRPEETKNGEAFSKDLASICDVFVNDAFGTAHRAHCSNVGVAGLVDTAVVGYLMQKEIDFLGNAVENPVRPFVAILISVFWRQMSPSTFPPVQVLSFQPEHPSCLLRPASFYLLIYHPRSNPHPHVHYLRLPQSQASSSVHLHGGASLYQIPYNQNRP